MEMETNQKMMKMSSEPQDQLSELPDSLVFDIFEFLPINDIIRTQILSHRWKKLWTLTPYLCFDNDYENLNDFAKFVSRVLLCWRGKMIQKFKIKSVVVLDESLFNELGLWMRFAVDYGVEELDISFPQDEFDPDVYCFPKCLFSCSSLKKLSIFVTSVEINVNNGNGMQWNQLESLEIHCFSITQHAIDLILSRSPVLEVFKLNFRQNRSKLSLSFRSNKLKELHVHKSRRSLKMFVDTELRIWAPNLETLTIWGSAYGQISLMDVSSLIHANLSFTKMDRLEAILSDILPAIRHVEGLTLSGCCIKVLGSTASNCLLSPFPNAVFLDLNGSFGKHEEIVGLLECFPKLKTLVVEEAKFIKSKSRKEKFKPNPSNSFLKELRTVKVTWTVRGLSIFPLLETLLNHASKLEKMVFHAKRITPPSDSSDFLLSKSQSKLLGMPRSSPNAKVIFTKIDGAKKYFYTS